jgi:hypothetical protein
MLTGRQRMTASGMSVGKMNEHVAQASFTPGATTTFLIVDEHRFGEFEPSYTVV